MNSSLSKFLNLILFIFLMLSVCMLRVFYLDNTQGLLFNELEIFDKISSFQFPAIFQNFLDGNLVFSLYSLILSWWSDLLGTEAYVLRFLSIIFYKSVGKIKDYASFINAIFNYKTCFMYTFLMFPRHH